MSKSLNSPTSRLLQSSRLFSLPRPLPPPSTEAASSAATFRASESATSPYPLYQAIATPASSHFRGDWGLKRPLPAKATRHTSTPLIRVKQQDTAAHITDFESAADHTRTEAKWRQMMIPLITKEARDTFTTSNQLLRSVYDDDLDNTDREAASTIVPSRYGRYTTAMPPRQMKRWKYKGSWLSGMKDGEFELYIMQTILKRKEEFRKFLFQRLVDRRVRDEERELRERGQQSGKLTPWRVEQISAELKANFEDEEKKLRHDHAQQHLSSELTAAICDFLDLPGFGGNDMDRFAQTDKLKKKLRVMTGDASGPPTTHPAAGLGHIRSNAFIENHPLWGPQAQKTPVLARVLRPRNQGSSVAIHAQIGVGGIVTNDSINSSWNQRITQVERTPAERYLEADEMTHQLDPDLEGGNKCYVQPNTASIDWDGRIKLDIVRGDREAIAVYTNDVEKIHESRRASLQTIPSVALPGTRGNANFGHSLPGRAPRSTGVRGFDHELSGRSSSQANDGLKRIQELMREGSNPRG